jgi:hypothetical protein
MVREWTKEMGLTDSKQMLIGGTNLNELSFMDGLAICLAW